MPNDEWSASLCFVTHVTRYFNLKQIITMICIQLAVKQIYSKVFIFLEPAKYTINAQ